MATVIDALVVTLGFDASIGMLIDTSRNGWGGAARPKAASTSTDVNTFVNDSRIDRRIHAGNWCNQSGAGLGERPKASPAAGIDAYVWVKPPGESDGSSTQIQNNDGKGFDRMCDPTYTGNERNGNSMTGALVREGHQIKPPLHDAVRLREEAVAADVHAIALVTDGARDAADGVVSFEHDGTDGWSALRRLASVCCLP